MRYDGTGKPRDSVGFLDPPSSSLLQQHFDVAFALKAKGLVLKAERVKAAEIWEFAPFHRHDL